MNVLERGIHFATWKMSEVMFIQPPTQNINFDSLHGNMNMAVWYIHLQNHQVATATQEVLHVRCMNGVWTQNY